MIIYGVALLSGCLLVGMLAGEVFGVLLGVSANVGGVGIAMLLLVLLPGYGGVIRNANRAVRDSLLYYDVRIRRIDRSLRSVTALGQEVTAYELWRGMFPNDDPAG